ncbi:MAG: smalltalk protein [Prevotella sp.]|nr:smalltalk protein [Prevotella sp.]
MKKETLKYIIQIAITILTALGTALGTMACQ